MKQLVSSHGRGHKLYYGWVVVAIMALLAFVAGTQTNPVLGVFQDPMTRELGWNRTAFTAPMTIGTILGGVVAVWVGAALDRHGGRWILAGAATLLGLVFILNGFVHHLWQHWLLQILGRGLMAGVFFLAANVVVVKWFVKKRGAATAVSGFGMRLGQTVLPVSTERIIYRTNWRLAWVFLGVLTLVTVPPVLKFMRRRPEDMGLLPDGTTAEISGTTEGLNKPPPASPTEASYNLTEARRFPAFYLLLSGAGIQTFIISAIHFHWFSYLTDRGISGGNAVASMALSSLLSIPVSLLSGVLIDRIQVRYVLSLGTLVIALSGFLLIITNTPTLAYSFGLLLAVATGMTSTASGLVWANYFGRASAGRIAGAVSPITMLLNAGGPLVAAMTFDIAASYTFIWAICVVLSLIGAACYAVAVPPAYSSVVSSERRG